MRVCKFFLHSSLLLLLVCSVWCFQYTSSVLSTRQQRRRLNVHSHGRIKRKIEHVKVLYASLDDSDYNIRSESRQLVSFLSFIGAIETAYLTYTKLSGNAINQVLCSNPSSCSTVLSGPYSTIPYLNVPISAIGCVAYTMIFILALQPLLSPTKTNIDANTSTLLPLTAIMATFSIYFVLLLSFVIHESCSFCYLSALLSITMALVSIVGRLELKDATKAFTLTSTAAAISGISAAFLYYTTSTLYPEEIRTYQEIAAMEKEEKALKFPPRIKTESSQQSVALANKIVSSQINGKMYGAYWCSHCNNQKQQFGVEAAKIFPYIECDKEGANSQITLCKEKKVPGFPTWELQGKLFPGEKSLDELEKIVDGLIDIGR